MKVKTKLYNVQYSQEDLLLTLVSTQNTFLHSYPNQYKWAITLFVQLELSQQASKVEIMLIECNINHFNYELTWAQYQMLDIMLCCICCVKCRRSYYCTFCYTITAFVYKCSFIIRSEILHILCMRYSILTLCLLHCIYCI